ncbi:sugar phosphate isomerase/epimerase family protein [Caballeronia ptereochthonis]|uniref:AP endonuclease, family 2 domain protein n=1 Tax=Caballeronia ptereochthonis TaxID=1777144 RepID=A0A158DGT3_9BURK|nr:sugar phosphate isomerase/epimerase family protein [Caballeronia ptereochthonis]SAK93673.1 AP endonuclease, family 2 domain protein [Caballeronia ptereochthonis]
MRNLTGRLDLCSINTATLGHREPLGRTIDRIARAGFGGIAPWRHEVEKAGVKEIAKQIKALDLTVTGYCRSTYLPASTHAQFVANIEANKAALRDAAMLGAKCFVMVVGGLPEGSRDLSGARAQVRDGIAALLETARDCGVPLALEPLHPMYAADRAVLNTLAQAVDICEALDPGGSGFLGVAVDVYHCWWDPALQASIAAAGGADRILAYHVCDWLRETRDLLLDRGMMGDGVVDLSAMREGVEGAGYDGLVEVEIFSKENWWRRDPDEVLRVCAERLQTVC